MTSYIINMTYLSIGAMRCGNVKRLEGKQIQAAIRVNYSVNDLPCQSRSYIGISKH